jgi:sentrin-specific protease 1
MALCLVNNKHILSSILEHQDNEMDVLQNGLMTISLSGDETERDVRRRDTGEEYKLALGELITRGNNEWISSWEECEEVLGRVFVMSREVGLADCGSEGEIEEEKKEDDISIVVRNSDGATIVSEEESAIVTLDSSTPLKSQGVKSKVLPKKAFPSPIKTKGRSSLKSMVRKTQRKKGPSHLSLDKYCKLIQNKVGLKLWNRVFSQPHHLTPTPIKEAESRLDEKIQALEASRTSKADELLARRQEEEQKRQAAQRASSLLRPLTDEEESIVQKALYGIGPPNEILASHEADSVQRSSLQRLQPGQWLNDEIINYFLKNCLAKRDEKLCSLQPGRKRSHFFNSYFVQTLFDEKNNNPALRGRYSYKNVKRWSKKVPGKDIFNLKYIFCPINLDNMHWTSAVIYMEEKKIQYYDSLGGTDRKKLEGLLEYVKDEWKVKKGSEMDGGEWRLVGCTEDTPRQLNGECILLFSLGNGMFYVLTLDCLLVIISGYDCGVFTCMFSDFISNDCPLVFDQKHVNQCRERIALSIMRNCAIE